MRVDFPSSTLPAVMKRKTGAVSGVVMVIPFSDGLKLGGNVNSPPEKGKEYLLVSKDETAIWRIGCIPYPHKNAVLPFVLKFATFSYFWEAN